MKKRIVFNLKIIGLILLIPLVAMQFTDEVSWNVLDFIIFGALLLGTSLLIELVRQKLHNSKYKLPIIIVVIIVFLLIWAELGVGIFGTPFAGN